MPDAETAVVIYVVPASKAVTDLHLQDPDVGPGEKPEPHDGRTRCGLVMLVADLWLPVERRDTDRVCRACRGISVEQATLL